jgi:acetolactate synthase-1/2/3 large subunit
MSESPRQPGIKRRQFLAGAAAAGPALAAASLAPAAAQAQPAPRPAVPATPAVARDQQPPRALAKLPAGHRCGADYMVDVLKGLDIEYVASCPGSTFRGFQEAIINYGGNTKPEFLTALHEDSSVHFAMGYAKITGKPMAAMVHGVVGLQHASMAIYNAFADQSPVFVIAGNVASEVSRRPGAESAHSSVDQAQMVRDFVKWDEQPASLRDFGNAAARAYQACVTGTPGPVLLVADADLQEESLHEDEMAQFRVARPGRRARIVADSGSVQEIARMLVNAENPVIMADRYGTSPEAIPRLIELAEALQAPVIDTRGRMNFPNTHPLNHTELAGATLRNADVVLALEPRDLFAMVNDLPDEIVRNARSRVKPETKVVRLGTTTLSFKSNYGASQRFTAADLEVPAEAEATLPALIEAVRREAKPSFAARGQKLRQATAGLRERARSEAVYGWDASPISTARLAAELWDQIKNDDYTLTTESQFQSFWPQRLWTMTKYTNYIGQSGGSGVGYNGPATIGAALANRAVGRLTVGIVGDGDFMMAPGIVWTAAHHGIPVLMIIHNNRGYHQEVMHIQRIAARNDRGVDRADIGTTIKQPNIDYAAMAKSMGVYAEGPVSNPNDLGPALRRALAVVKRGEPALVDVVTQPR